MWGANAKRTQKIHLLIYMAELSAGVLLQTGLYLLILMFSFIFVTKSLKFETSLNLALFSVFMARLTVVRGPLCFCLVRPSVMGVNFFWSKNTFYGVLRRFMVFLTFSIFVRACVRALRSMY